MNTKIGQNGKNAQKYERKEVLSNSKFFPVKKKVLGIEITDALDYEILESIVDFIENSKKNAYIVTPNPEMIVAATKSLAFKNALNQADVALCDGFGLYVGSRIVGKPVLSRIIGTNFVENLCEKVVNRPITVGFLGGGSRIAVTAAERLQKKYPGLVVAFAGEEWLMDYRGPAARHPHSTSSITSFPAGAHRGTPTRVTPQDQLSTLNNKPVDILFVAFGHPKQELWMAEHVGKIPVRVMMGVGGAFDQFVDPTLRPPLIISSIGMGWLYRLIREPWRFKRQLALLTFLGMVVRERFKKYLSRPNNIL
jgi:N-acetylglucosaminyldiphosphoundecaprenol N-acetyl-beta-D-mannosaminyltransferase